VPPAPRGIPQIEVVFEINADGIVQVSARDKMTGLEQAMRVTPSSGLSASEIYDLINEAQINAEADRKTKELLLLKSRLEGLMQNTQRSFSEFGWMLSANDQEMVRDTLLQAKDGLASQDPLLIRQLLEALEHAAKVITDAMFSPAASGQEQGPSSEADAGESGTKLLTE
ncbi:MAG TPA: Hsp70 family protein, partial [Acidobacteriota bacterium]|nr:Hsp70 family protein [Acidobacteriota bacterium]